MRANLHLITLQVCSLSGYVCVCAGVVLWTDDNPGKPNSGGGVLQHCAGGSQRKPAPAVLGSEFPPQNYSRPGSGPGTISDGEDPGMVGSESGG